MAEICRGLDGIPLAIELAAARVGALTVEQIAKRLENSLKLLAGSRTASPRQRTLKGALDWSFELLSEEERDLFGRLSVFAGGWTWEAAGAGGAGTGIEEDVLDLLLSLVDKSLVVVRERDGEARYRLLEMVRRYGREKLEESGEAAVIRGRHARFFLTLAEEVEPRIRNAGRRPWLAWLDAEQDNLRAALRWAEETGEPETGSRLAAALFWFWFHAGYWSEGYAWLERALAIEGDGGAQTRTAARASLLRGAGSSAWVRGDHATALSRLEESVEICREVGDEQTLAYALHTLGLEMLSRGEPAAARSLAEESVEVSRGGEDTFGLTTSLTCLGIVVLNQGEYALATSLLEESVELCREVGDDWSLSLPLRNLGTIAFRRGDHERAEALLKESLAVLREQAEKWYITRSLEYLAVVASVQGDHARAARLFGAGEALREVLGSTVITYSQTDYDRGIAAARAGLGEQSFASTWAEGRAMDPEQAIGYALSGEEEPRAMVPEKPPPDRKPTTVLTRREQEVAVLVTRDLTNRQIARELTLSEHTVATHVRKVLKKLGLRSRTQIAAWAMEQRLLP